mmetsp:Transcript_10054/g.17168  ORF Transcript_10054/g.17168 Transcript_10054/m.17168 type:complete len:85 (+) Transcript_10054:1412-1666(+)
MLMYQFQPWAIIPLKQSLMILKSIQMILRWMILIYVLVLVGRSLVIISKVKGYVCVCRKWGYSFAYESIWCGIVGYNVSDKTKM